MRALRVAAAIGGAAAICVCGVVAATGWRRFGRKTAAADGDPLLEVYMPDYDVIERDSIRVDAPAEIAYQAACGLELERSALIRAIFRLRQIALLERPASAGLPLVEQARQWGWGVLAEEPGRVIVFGAATQPWTASPQFRSLPPARFAGFREPGFVKIAWVLRAKPVGGQISVALTETRAAATDECARRRFRRYWAIVWPGVKLIRKAALLAVRHEARRLTRRRSSAACLRPGSDARS